MIINLLLCDVNKLYILTLYKPETILKANPNKPAYHNFISRTDDKHSDIVLLELSDEKENYQYLGKNGGVAQYPEKRVNDAIITKTRQVVKTDPQDYIFTMK